MLEVFSIGCGTDEIDKERRIKHKIIAIKEKARRLGLKMTNQEKDEKKGRKEIENFTIEANKEQF